MLNVLRLLIIITFFSILASSAHVNDLNAIIEKPKENVKSSRNKLYVVLVHSYNINHICGTPQEIGFLNMLNDLVKDKYTLKVESYYLNGKGKSDIELEINGKKLAQKIQVKNPDIIVSFDDLAVEHVLSRTELESYPKLSSGLNKLVKEYLQDGYKLANFCGIVEETVDFTNFKSLVQKNKFLKNKRINVLIDKNTVSKQLLRDFKYVFSNSEYVLHEIDNINQIDFLFKKLNHKKDIVVNFLQVINDGKEIILKDKIISYITTVYPDFIHVTTNKSSISFGADISVGIDFKEMPTTLENSLHELIFNKKCTGEITKAKNSLYINYNSIKLSKFDFSKDESNIIEIVK